MDIITKVTKQVINNNEQAFTLLCRHPLPSPPWDLPNMYKRSIVFFRALYTYIRLLPCHDLYRRLQQYGALDVLDIGYRITADPLETQTDQEVDLGKGGILGWEYICVCHARTELLLFL